MIHLGSPTRPSWGRRSRRSSVEAPLDRRGARRLRALRVGRQGRAARARADRGRARRAREDAPPRRQRRRRGRRLRRPDRHPARALGRGGPRRRPRARSWRSTRASRSRTCSSRAAAGRRGGRHGARADEPRRACGSSPSARTSSTAARSGPPAREEEPLFWQVGGADRGAARAASSSTRPARGRRSTCTWPRCSTDTVVYKVLGAPRALGGYFPDLLDRARQDRGGARPQPLLDQHLAALQARAAVRRARPQRRDQHDRAAAPGGAHARRAARPTAAPTRRTSTARSRR